MSSLEKMAAKASERFEPGETAIVSVLGISKRITTDTDLQKPAVLVATDRRVVLYAKDLLSHAFESYRYGDITSAMISNGALAGGEATLSVAGNAVSVYRIRKGDIELFESTVRERMDAAKRDSAAGGSEPTPTRATISCSSCGTNNPKGTKFCGDCGAPLGHVCPQCGAVVSATFCGECGTRID